MSTSTNVDLKGGSNQSLAMSNDGNSGVSIKTDGTSQTQVSSQYTAPTQAQKESSGGQRTRGQGGMGRGRGRGGRGRGRGGREGHYEGRADTSSQTATLEVSTTGEASIETVMTKGFSAHTKTLSSIGDHRLQDRWPLKVASDMKNQVWSKITSLILLYLGQMEKELGDDFKKVIER